jgi:hypothetical protein
MLKSCIFPVTGYIASMRESCRMSGLLLVYECYFQGASLLTGLENLASHCLSLGHWVSLESHPSPMASVSSCVGFHLVHLRFLPVLTVSVWDYGLNSAVWSLGGRSQVAGLGYVLFCLSTWNVPCRELTVEQCGEMKWRILQRRLVIYWV